MIKIIMIPEPFNMLSEKDLISIQVDKGGVVFHQNASVRGPHLVLQGDVELIRHSKSGDKIILHKAAMGDTLAEASLFSENYHCDCVATTPSQLVIFRKSAVLALFASNPKFARDLLKQQARQVQTYRHKIELLAIKSAEERVLTALTEIGQRGSVMSFARQIGLTHEATYRALSILVKNGQITRLSRGKYRVTD